MSKADDFPTHLGVEVMEVENGYLVRESPSILTGKFNGCLGRMWVASDVDALATLMMKLADDKIEARIKGDF